jgi:hypothetical protein
MLCEICIYYGCIQHSCFFAQALAILFLGSNFDTRILEEVADGHAAKSTVHMSFATNPDRAVNQLPCGACTLTGSLLCVQEHCVLVQQHTKKKEAVSVLNMVQDTIVTVGFNASVQPLTCLHKYNKQCTMSLRNTSGHVRIGIAPVLV